MQVTVVDHPLAAQLLTRLRDERTDRAGFRRAMDDLSGILVYEASRDIEAEPIAVTTPMGPTTGVQIARPPLVVPVLRAGLGMLGGVLRHLPETDTGFIGVARNEETFVPEPYMNSVPDELHGRPVPGARPDAGHRRLARPHLPASSPTTAPAPSPACACWPRPRASARLEASGLVSHVVTASIDERLNDHAYIIPGLGDAGDRLFGTA